MGFDLELFVDAIVESLICNICNAVYRDPVITSCGHVYCEQCLREWLSNRTECPKACKQISLENDITHLLPLQILVERLRTRCVNFTQGCEVVTPLAEMLAHLEVCDYTKKDMVSGVTGLPSASCSIERVSRPEVGTFVCSKGCGLPLLFQGSSEHNCVKSLQAQVCSLQTKLTRSEHEREKVSARLVKREESMQERFTQLERDLRSYQEQTLNYERRSRDQRSQINYLRRQLDSRGSDQVTEESEVRITLVRSGGTLGLNIRGGTEENDGHCGIYVSKIVENTPASEKLQLYDRILEINEVDLTNASHQDAVKAFKNAGDQLDITVRRLLNPKAGDMFSSGFVSIGVQTEAIDPSETRMPITCCRCRSNRSSQEFSSQGAINIIHQKEDSGVDETGEHQSDADGCEANELKNNTGYTSDDVKPHDEILSRLLLNTSLAALEKRTNRILPADAGQTPYEPEDSSELQSLSNGYYSGNVSQASLENVKPAENGGLDSTTQQMAPDEECYSPVNETDQLYFDSELEYEYEEITIRMCGRKALGMKLFSGDGEDANSVFVDEVDPRSVVGKDGRVIEGDQILKINDLAVTCLEDAVGLLSERHNEIKFLVARPVAELQATLLGAESDHGEAFHDQSRFHLEAFPIGVIQEEDENEAETVIGDKSREDEKDSGFGRTDDSTKNDSEQDGGDDRLPRDEKEQHKAQMDALGKQIIHFTACASNARELGLRDSPREKSSDEHSQRSGEREKRDGRSTKHSSRKSGNKTSSDENHSSGHEHKSKTPKSHKSSRNSESCPAGSKSKERSEGKEKDRSEHRRKKERSRDGGDSSRSIRSSRDDRASSKDDRGSNQNGHQSSNENPEPMKVEWRVRRNKDGSRIFISKKLKPAKQRLLRERAQKLAEERRGLTTDDETQSVYLGRYWSREDRRRQLGKVREARQTKKVEMEAERKAHGGGTKRNDFQIIELTQKKMACTEKTFDDFMTVEEILRQRNRLGMSTGPIFVTTV